VLERRHVEIADRIARAFAAGRSSGSPRISSKERACGRISRWCLWIGLVAARRHVEIMQRRGVAQAGLLASVTEICRQSVLLQKLRSCGIDGRRESTATP